MATIGTFHRLEDGGFSGSIRTVNLDAKPVIFRPVGSDNDKAPDFRIFAGPNEFGAAWKRTSRQNRDYLSVKLDDPTFPAPIHASLVEAEDGYELIWSR